MLEKSDEKKLFEAAEHNDVQTVRRFIEENGVPANITNDRGQTLVHAAIGKNGLDVVKYVLEQEPSLLTELDNDDYAVLHLAVEKGDIDVVKYLCEEYDAQITEPNRRDLARSAVHTAAQFGRLDILKYFVDERGVDVDMCEEWIDKPPVFIALQYRQYDVLEYFVEEKGADLTQVDFFGENILYIAVRVGDLDFMKRLLDVKHLALDINWQNNNKETVVFKAVSLNQTDIVKYLVDKKHANVNIPEKWDNTTCLHVAAAQNDLKLCKFLIAHGAKTRAKDRSGEIPAQKATDETLIEYMKEVSLKVRRPRGVADSSFQPIPTISYECTQRRFEQQRSGAVARFGENAMSEGSMFLSLFSVVVESLASANPVKLYGYQSLSSPRASVQQKIDPVAEDVVFGISRYDEKL